MSIPEFKSAVADPSGQLISGASILEVPVSLEEVIGPVPRHFVQVIVLDPHLDGAGGEGGVTTVSPLNAKYTPAVAFPGL